jgi:hypothetical protein
VRAANDLLSGHEPHIVVTLAEGKGMTDARLVTNSAELEASLEDHRNRSMIVPRVLPYQLGGSQEGATAVIYSPAAGGGMRVHSMHPTDQEAQLAHEELKAKGESKSGTMRVATTVTQLLALVARGEFKPASVAEAAPSNAQSEGVPSPASLRQSPLRPPSTMSPFAERA